MKWLHHLDAISRIALINIVAIATFIIFICFIAPLAESPYRVDAFIFSFSTPEHAHLNILAILIAIFFGSLTALLTRPHECSQKKAILGLVLSNDEQAALDIIKQGEITQDSLMYRLHWSRPKISGIVSNLERYGLVQRKRQGKTYSVQIT